LHLVVHTPFHHEVYATTGVMNIAGRLVPGLAIGQTLHICPGITFIITGDNAQICIMSQDVDTVATDEGPRMHEGKQASLLPGYPMVITGIDPALPGVAPFTSPALGPGQIRHPGATLIHRRQESTRRQPHQAW
jgi:hypothetical protein